MTRVYGIAALSLLRNSTTVRESAVSDAVKHYCICAIQLGGAVLLTYVR